MSWDLRTEVWSLGAFTSALATKWIPENWDLLGQTDRQIPTVFSSHCEEASSEPAFPLWRSLQGTFSTLWVRIVPCSRGGATGPRSWGSSAAPKYRKTVTCTPLSTRLAAPELREMMDQLSWPRGDWPGDLSGDVHHRELVRFLTSQPRITVFSGAVDAALNALE